MSAAVKSGPSGAAMPGGVTAPQTGNEYLNSLRDDRTVFIYGERVKDATTHPAFRNTARMVARLYDSLPFSPATLVRGDQSPPDGEQADIEAA